MKVLFVSSGNSKFGITPIVKSQGESLKRFEIDIQYFSIKGKGFLNYLRNILLLKKHLKINKYDLLHSHYVLSGWVALFASNFRYPIVLSLMGDDAYGSFNSKGKLEFLSIYLIILTKFIQPFVNKIIVKSQNISKAVYFKNKVFVIPNGVNLRIFHIIDKNEAKKYLGLDPKKKYLLFVSDPSNPRKNFNLLKEAFNTFQLNNLEILTSFPSMHELLPYYYNSADIMVSTSTAEGSPNVIKEAMACNCPIVSTDVGDVRWVFGNTKGCYLTSFEPNDVAEKIRLALDFSEKVGRTNGRERIIELGLDSDSIAKRIIQVYQRVLYSN